MDDVLQAQFDRVEQALGNLVDSIASYNPNPQAALDLVAADDELSHGLDQLARHQANHARLQALRAEADTLEAQLKSSVAALAGLRKELVDTPATVFPSESRRVPFDELLHYAKSISRYTVPPTFRERIPDLDGAEKEADADAVADADVNTNTNTNAPSAPTSAPATTALNTPTLPTTDPIAPDEPPLNPTTANEEEEEWLQKLKATNFSWFPWPDADKIRRGNLWKLYHYREQGRDMASFEIEKHEEEERKKFSDDHDDAAGLVAQVPEEPKIGLVGMAARGDGEGERDGQDTAMAVSAQETLPASSAPLAAQPKAGFTLFDDMESDEE